jgi:uncharacterized protein (TIGR02679 family)
VRPELRRILDDLPGLADVLERAAARYVQLSRVGGTVEVEPRERRSVERLGCRLNARGRVGLDELDRALRSSRLAAALPEVLEELRGRALVTRQEARAHEDAAWLALVVEIEAMAAPAWVARWLHDHCSSLRAEWRRQGDEWSTGVRVAVRAAAVLSTFDDGTELPHLAYRACGDAHGLDSDRPAGRIFERLLLHRYQEAGLSLPLSAETRESLFAMAGLAIDELSSTVHVVGLTGADPVVAAAREGRHVLALPLRTVYAISGSARAHRDTVFAVENRSVLSVLHRELTDIPSEAYPTLVCTGGHLSLAALRLLDHLALSGAIVRYSGDFDASGLMIADALAARLGGSFQPWRMDAEAFEHALRGRTTSRKVDPGRAALGATTRFPELARMLEAHGAAFQEGLSDLLLTDLRGWTAGRVSPPDSTAR